MADTFDFTDVEAVIQRARLQLYQMQEGDLTRLGPIGTVPPSSSRPRWRSP